MKLNKLQKIFCGKMQSYRMQRVPVINRQPKLTIFDMHGVLYGQGDDGKYVVDEEMVDIVRDLLSDETRHVAIWSSALPKNIHNHLREIFADDAKKFVFVWGRDRVKIDPDRIADTPYATYKDINDLLLHPFINRRGCYTSNNILMIDDSYEKVRRNHRRTYYIWQGKNRNYDRLRELLF